MTFLYPDLTNFATLMQVDTISSSNEPVDIVFTGITDAVRYSGSIGDTNDDDLVTIFGSIGEHAGDDYTSSTIIYDNGIEQVSGKYTGQIDSSSVPEPGADSLLLAVVRPDRLGSGTVGRDADEGRCQPVI